MIGSEGIRKEFGKEYAAVFEIIINEPEITAASIAERIGKSSRTIEKYLAKLKKAELIIRTGPKLGGRWETLDD